MRLHNVVKQEQELIICPSVRVRPGMRAEYVLPIYNCVLLLLRRHLKSSGAAVVAAAR